jgi:hypothetical protein
MKGTVMRVFAQGPRPVLTTDVDPVVELYLRTRSIRPQVIVRLAELYTTRLNAAEQQILASTLEQAMRIASRPATSVHATLRALHTVGIALEGSCRGGTDVLREVVTIVGWLLRGDNTAEAVGELVEHCGTARLAAEMAQFGFGLDEPRCAQLLTAYVGVEDMITSRWVIHHLGHNPTPAWLVPVLIDVAHHTKGAADARIRYAGLIRRWAKRPLTAAQADVALTLAYDGGLAPEDIITTARLLA